MVEDLRSLLIFSGTNIPKNGVYTLVIFVPFDKKMLIGKMGVQKFLRGHYAYTGSALGKGAQSLEGRISRHLKKNKKEKWHIDFLLTDEDVKVTSVFIAPTAERMECKINQYMMKKLNGEIPVLKFGSSDCKEQCGSHLLYLGYNRDITEKVTNLYKEKVGEKLIILNYA